MADFYSRTTSFAKSLDTELPAQSARPDFNRHAMGVQAEASSGPAQPAPASAPAPERSSAAPTLRQAFERSAVTVRPVVASDRAQARPAGSEMVKKTAIVPTLKPTGPVRDAVDRQSYNERLAAERARMVERNRIAVARSSSQGKELDRGREV